MTAAAADTAAEAATTGSPVSQAAALWEDPPRGRASAASPVLAVDGFEGPLDWLLELARSRRIDLARLSIVAVVEAFGQALDAALERAPGAPAVRLTQWAAWTVMAAQLTELRSRLLLPAAAPEARSAVAEAEALRHRWLPRAEIVAAAGWLARRPQLGIEVFARGRPETAWTIAGSAGQATNLDVNDSGQDASLMLDEADDLPVLGGDITDLLRACLVALRLPPHAQAYQPRTLPFWSIGDATGHMTRLLETAPDSSKLEVYLPAVAGTGSDRALHARAAIAATLVAALELSRCGTLTLEQEAPWQEILVKRSELMTTE